MNNKVNCLKKQRELAKLETNDVIGIARNIFRKADYSIIQEKIVGSQNCN